MTKIKLRYDRDWWGQQLSYDGQGSISEVVTSGLIRKGCPARTSMGGEFQEEGQHM